MTAFGDPAGWAERFRSFDVRFLECVDAIWPECRSVLPDQPHEDAITFNLVEMLWKDSRIRALFHWIEYHYEPSGRMPGGRAYPKGQIDMVLFLDRERGRYLAYECKRLNVKGADGTRSLAVPYVMEGMLRFVREQYAENLPVGCMLGYVLDGKVSPAQKKIYEAINSRKSDIGITGEPVREKPIGRMKRFSSCHVRAGSGKEIEIRHALLPFPVQS